MLQTKKGFTIIEILLAMTMVSFLMMAIAMMILQMTSLMTKGNTFRELNAAGRTINDDFTRSFNSLQTGDFNPATDRRNVGSGGILCTGKFSYLWNNAAAFRATGSGRNFDIRYNGEAASDSSIKLIRIADPTKIYCQSIGGGSGIAHLSQIDRSQAKELIGQGEVDLMIQDIRFEQLAMDQNSFQSIVRIVYVLTTRDGVNTTATACDPTGDRREYCAINKFELIVRTLGRG